MPKIVKIGLNLSKLRPKYRSLFSGHRVVDFIKVVKNLLQKTLPRSPVTLDGIPNLETTSLKKTLSVVSASKLGTGPKIGHPPLFQN